MGVEPPRSRCRLMAVTPLRRDGTAGREQPAGGKEPAQGGGGGHYELLHTVFVKTTATTLFACRASETETERARLVEQLRETSVMKDQMEGEV